MVAASGRRDAALALADADADEADDDDDVDDGLIRVKGLKCRVRTWVNACWSGEGSVCWKARAGRGLRTGASVTVDFLIRREFVVVVVTLAHVRGLLN